MDVAIPHHSGYKSQCSRGVFPHQTPIAQFPRHSPLLSLVENLLPMCEPWVFEMFGNDGEWLEKEPEMAIWDEGCQRLARLLLSRLRQYAPDVCTKMVEEDEEETYVRRLWKSLGHHWRTANAVFGIGKVKSVQVAEQIQKGKGYRRGGRLGGNPLRDVVLAVAMVAKDERAIAVFTEDYRGFAVGLAYRIDKRLAKDPDEWWFELVDHLAGYSEPTGRLDKFVGRCALRNWLGTVVWNFLRPRRLPEGTPSEPPEPVAPTPVSIDDESLKHFDEIVHSAVSMIHKTDRLLLALVYIDGLTQKEAASIAGISAGQATRRLRAAYHQLNMAIRQKGRDKLSEDAMDSIFQELDENRQAFGEILRRALEHGRKEKS